MAMFSFDILPLFLSLKCKRQEQQETIDSIENNIESAQVNVQEGTRQLGKVSYWKTLKLQLYSGKHNGSILLWDAFNLSARHSDL